MSEVESNQPIVPPPGQAVDSGDKETTTEKDQPIVTTELAPEDKRTPAEYVDGLLRKAWRDAHSDHSWDDADVERFVSELGRVTDVSTFAPKPLLDALMHGDDAKLGTALPGDISEVQLRISALANQLGEPGSTAAFVRRALAATVERLERDGVGSREERVDLIVRIVRDVAGRPATARLALALHRYLAGQTSRTLGYYVTVTNLASLMVTTAESSAELFSSFLHHHALLGALRLARTRELDTSESLAATVVTNSSHNLAAVLAQHLQKRRDPEVESEARPMLRRLMTIAASAATRRGGEVGSAWTVSLLHLDEDVPAPDIITALHEMGSIPMAWDSPSIDLAWLEASSAVAVLSSDDPTATAARLFNAGISLNNPTLKEPEGSVARCLMNAFGLLAAVTLAPDLPSALTTFHGLDCAVNFLGASTRVKVENHAEWAVIHPLARLVASLPRHLIRNEPELARNLELDFGRIAGSSRQLALNGEEPVGHDALGAVAVGAVRQLIGRDPTPDRLIEQNELIELGAFVLDQVFRTILGQEKWSLRSEVLAVARSRQHPDQTLVEQYERFAEPRDDELGASPLVPWVTDEETWQGIGRELLDPIDSIVSSLRAFPPDP